MNIEMKTNYTDAVAKAVADSGKTRSERIFLALNTAHDDAGSNEPLKFDKAEANRVAFDAIKIDFKSRGESVPTGVKYDVKEFGSFNARHTETNRLLFNVEH
jgi:hypothetical protein